MSATANRAATAATCPARAPRVLMVSEWHAKYVTWLSAAMADHGAHVRLLTRDHDLEFGGEAGHAEPGTMARWVGETLDGRARHEMLPGRVRDLGAIPAALRLAGRVQRMRPDYVHLQDAVAQDFRLPLISGVVPGRYALTVHDVTQHPGDQVRRGRTAQVRELLIRHAGVTFVHSEPLREALIELERPRGAVEVVPHGIPAPDPRPLPAEPHVLFFGRISRYKGVDVLLDAMAEVFERLPEARLTIAGYGELPEHPGFEDARVTVRNEYIPEEALVDLFATARCVVLPYIEGSQSGVGSRAKGIGRPLVVTRVGGLPDLVADGGGHVVEPGESGPLADALADVLADDGVAEEMSRRALDSVAASSWESVAEQTLAAYERHLPARRY